jgi:hypothetical protein
MPSFRVIAMDQGNAGGQSRAPITAQDGWHSYTGDHIGLHRNLYEPGFVYCVDRAFVSTCGTPCLVLAGNDEAHPLRVSEELARLFPNCELIPEWKAGAALTSASARVKEFLSKHTPRA